MKHTTRTFTAVAAAALLLAGCGDAAEDDAAPSEADLEADLEDAPDENAAEQDAPEPEVADDSDPAILLATIDAGPNPDSGTVGTYTSALDAAAAKCEQDRQEVADISARMFQLAGDEGVDTTTLDLLMGLDEAIPGDQAPMDCAEIGAALLALMTQQ